MIISILLNCNDDNLYYQLSIKKKDNQVVVFAVITIFVIVKGVILFPVVVVPILLHVERGVVFFRWNFHSFASPRLLSKYRLFFLVFLSLTMSSIASLRPQSTFFADLQVSNHNVVIRVRQENQTRRRSSKRDMCNSIELPFLSSRIQLYVHLVHLCCISFQLYTFKCNVITAPLQ
ncbi:uncharacterized protein BX664DRAFT_343279 [Halteromyces radiatus]|uniref:uncharacterized protein n=1 Tax=Halteromyces radiatus TaxID=101107 RepID=UPI00221FF002|nr:uncharacterized protein BX664DRAFT_343279 [Halteromyces radiatus]KAI8077705.1 hypothetical protein BX664DRAFT_343279 [Halteromyces radiatus]